MNINWKIVAPFGVLLLLGLLFLFSGKQDAQVALAPVPHEEQMPVASQVSNQGAPASGNVDELTASLDTEADVDQAEFAESDQDLALVSSDSQSINGLGTSYDETTF